MTTIYTNQSKSSSSFSNLAKNVSSFVNAARTLVVFGDIAGEAGSSDTFETVRGLNGETVGALTFDSLVGPVWSNQTKN